MRTAMTREFYIPKNSTKVQPEGSDVEAYYYVHGTKLAAAVFAGKSVKPVSHYTFKDEVSREKHVQQLVANRNARKVATAMHRLKRTQKHTLEVGDILDGSWGYDMTRVEFWQVVARTDRTVTVRQLKQSSTETGFLCGTTVPIPNSFVTDGKEVRAVVNTAGQSIKVDHVWLSKWEGRPRHFNHCD